MTISDHLTTGSRGQEPLARTAVAPIGLIVPPAAGKVPPDAHSLYPHLHFIAAGLGLTEMSVQGYDSVIDSVGRAADRLSRAGAGVVSLMGTSLSFYRGPEFNAAIEREMATRAGVPTLTMSSAILAALNALAVRRIAVATAYKGEVNDKLRQFLESAGFEVLSLAPLGVTSIDAVHDVPEAAVTEIGRNAFKAAVRPEAILISCGGLTTRAAVRTLEAETGVPVVTSPLAGLWATLKRAGLDPRVSNEGRLLQLS